MKKSLLIGAIALSGALSAQVNFGVKAGYNLSNLSVTSPATSIQVLMGNKSGFNAGAVVEYGFGNNLSLQGEVAYNLLGGSATIDVSKLPNNVAGKPIEDFISDIKDIKKVEVGLSLHQISVPISLKYKFNNFAVLGGANLNFIVGSNLKAKNNGTDVKHLMEKDMDTSIDTIISENLSTANLGLHIGAEYTFSNNIFLDTKYNFGLTSLNKNFTDLANLKQRYFQLGVGYKFK